MRGSPVAFGRYGSAPVGLTQLVSPGMYAPQFAIEHEVRSLRHPLYGRTFVNRNPAQTNNNYVPGRDAWVPEHIAVEMDNPRQAERERRYGTVR